MNKEIWKDIEGYENLYQISNLGRVKSLRKNRLMKQQKRYNYYRIRLINNNKIGKNFVVHKLVAIAFLNKQDFKYYNNSDKQKYINSLNKLVVNHKDENTFNNNVNNLEWCTQRYNNNYGNRINKIKKSIIQYDINGNYIKNWDSIKEAKIKLKLSNIDKALNGKYKKCGNFIWKYKEEK